MQLAGYSANRSHLAIFQLHLPLDSARDLTLDCGAVAAVNQVAAKFVTNQIAQSVLGREVVTVDPQLDAAVRSLGQRAVSL